MYGINQFNNLRFGEQQSPYQQNQPFSVNQMISQPDLPYMGFMGDPNAYNNIGQGADTLGINAFDGISAGGQGGQGIGASVGKWFSNGDNLKTLAGIGQSLAGFYLGKKQLKQGERALNMQENLMNNNLTHNIQSYNTKLADQAKARGYTQGQSDAEIQDHIDKNSLKRV